MRRLELTDRCTAVSHVHERCIHTLTHTHTHRVSDTETRMQNGGPTHGNAALARKLLVEAQLSIQLGPEEPETPLAPLSPPSPPPPPSPPSPGKIESSPMKMGMNTGMNSRKASANFASTLTTIVLWYAANIGTLLLNKLLMSTFEFKFPVREKLFVHAARCLHDPTSHSRRMAHPGEAF